MAQSGYKTIRGFGTDEFVERKSRFIGSIQPVSTEEEAVALIQSVKERHREANHNVYAYVLREGQIRRYSDDGEPQGTGGVPVLEVLLKEGLVDCCVVVTRYFGGVLLGAGGLVRAYSHGAKLAVDAAGILNMQPCTVLELTMDYSLYGKITYILPRYETVVEDSDFGAAVRLRILMKDEHLPRFAKDLEELTSAQVFPHVLEKRYAHIAP